MHTRSLCSFGDCVDVFGGKRRVRRSQRDSTQEYLDAYRSDCAFGTAHAEVLRRHKVLLVPSYFSDLDPVYFSDQLHWLTSIGVEHQKVPVKSRQGVAINSPIIATAIRDSTKPVILITHSKGSVDALDALRAETSLRTKVKGWISLQGAFFGSPVADMLLDGARLNPLVATVILQYFGGTRESARSLTTGASLAYYRDNKPAIDEVVREVPAVQRFDRARMTKALLLLLGPLIRPISALKGDDWYDGSWPKSGRTIAFRVAATRTGQRHHPQIRERLPRAHRACLRGTQPD